MSTLNHSSAALAVSFWLLGGCGAQVSPEGERDVAAPRPSTSSSPELLADAPLVNDDALAQAAVQQPIPAAQNESILPEPPVDSEAQDASTNVFASSEAIMPDGCRLWLDDARSHLVLADIEVKFNDQSWLGVDTCSAPTKTQASSETTHGDWELGKREQGLWLQFCATNCVQLKQNPNAELAVAVKYSPKTPLPK